MQLAQIKNPAYLTNIIYSLVTGSFEKKFKNQKPNDVINAFAFVSQDLDEKQLETGIKILIEKAFCPDPALFCQWCLGNRDFSFDDEIADSYVDKHGALANIIKWLETNGKSPISQAEKWAYDESYHLWQSIHSESDRTKAELAFKGYYAKKIAELIKNRVMCQVYVAPVAIAQSTDKPKNEPASREYAMSILQNIGKNLKQELGEVA